MISQIANDLKDFHQFLGEKCQQPHDGVTPEMVLDEWRELHPEPELTDEEIADIEEALVAWDNGDRGVPFEEFDRDFRARHGMPPKS